MRSFLLMIQFMTRYPVPVSIDFTSDRFVEGLKWMPLVGLLLGAPSALLLFLLAPLCGEEVAAVFAVIYLITATGGLHLDGLADTSDGLFSYKPRERVLSIMREPTLGTNAVIAIVLDIILKFLLIKNIGVAGGVPALCIVPVLGRLASAWHAASAQYAREGAGLGEFVNRIGWPQACSATLTSFILVSALLFCTPLSPVCALLCAIFLHGGVMLAAVFFARYLTVRIGGITGDTMGATIELTEIIALFLFHIAWNNLI